MTYELTWETDGVCWKYSGQVSGMEIFKATMQAYGDARFDEVKYKLVDLLDADLVEMNENIIQAIAGQHKMAEQTRPNVKNALIVRSTKSKYANLFSELLSDSSWDVRVFDNLNEANQWLGRD